MDALDGLQWGTRLFLVIVLLGIVVLAALPLVVLVRPVVTEAMRSGRAGDWWLPFLPDDSGAFGPLASNAWWSVFRARERGAAGGLAWRWGFWVVMAVALSAIAAWIVVMAVRLVRLGWS